jgi:hypothetical protein
MNPNVFETRYIRLHIQEGILIAYYKPGLHITLEVAKEIVQSRKEFTEGKSYPALVNSTGVVSIERAAREYFSSPEGTAGIKAAALIVNSPFSSFLGNFFLRVNKPGMPAKVFTREQSALNWLQQYL